MKNSKLIYLGIAQSIGVFIYTAGVAWLFSHGEKLAAKPDTFLMPAAMLMLFVVSAVITGLIVLGKPISLYFDGLKKEAVKLLVYTIVFLIMIVFLVVSFAIIN